MSSATAGAHMPGDGGSHFCTFRKQLEGACVVLRNFEHRADNLLP